MLARFSASRRTIVRLRAEGNGHPAPLSQIFQLLKLCFVNLGGISAGTHNTNVLVLCYGFIFVLC